MAKECYCSRSLILPEDAICRGCAYLLQGFGMPESLCKVALPNGDWLAMFDDDGVPRQCAMFDPQYKLNVGVTYHPNELGGFNGCIVHDDDEIN